MTPKEILAENWEQIEGICRRLPAKLALCFAGGTIVYASESSMKVNARIAGDTEQYLQACAKKQRGQRLVVIVTASETLYQFV